MNIPARKTLLAVASVAAIGTGLLTGMASADSSSQETIVDKLATKFHLNKSEVQAVFDQDRQEHAQHMKANRAQRLAQAVKDGKLTQAQADHITSALNEIDSLRGNTPPGKLDDATRTKIKDTMETLHTWAKQNNVDMKYIGGPGFGPHHGMEIGKGMHQPTPSADDSSQQ